MESCPLMACTTGRRAVVVNVGCDGAEACRLRAMGIYEGARVSVVDSRNGLLLQVRGGGSGPHHRALRQSLDRLHHLAGLLHQVGHQTAMGLLGVPRALLPQRGHHRDEPLQLP